MAQQLSYSSYVVWPLRGELFNTPPSEVPPLKMRNDR